MNPKILLAGVALLALVCACGAPVLVTPTEDVGQVEAAGAVTPPGGTDTPPPAPTPTATPTPAPPRPQNAIDLLVPGSPVTITRIHMLTALEGWGLGGTAGGSDHVLKTQDGGNTWRDVTPPEPQPQAGEQRSAVAAFLDPQSAWVTYYTSNSPPAVLRSTVWRTTDGGLSWSESSELFVSDLNEFYTPSHLVFADTQTGWLMAHVGVGMNHDYIALFHTTDGGESWLRWVDPYTDSTVQSCSKNDLVFTSPENGWLTGDCNGVAPGVLLFKTGDGGMTWVSVELPPPADKPDLFSPDFVAACGSYTPEFLDNLNGRLVVRCQRYDQDPMVTEYFLYATTDGGASWTSGAYPGGSLYLAGARSGLALGVSSYATADGGQNWNWVGGVNWEGDYSFIDAQTGWAVARDGEKIYLVKTANGAATWQMLTPVIAP